MKNHPKTLAWLSTLLPLSVALAAVQPTSNNATQPPQNTTATPPSAATLPAETIAPTLADAPPNAKPGECYARVLLPAKYETVEEDVVIQEATEKITIIPAQFETSEEKVMVVPEYKQLVVSPSTYMDINETIEVKPVEHFWASSLDENATPVNPDVLSVVAKGGIDLNQTQPNTCYAEYYQPRQYQRVDEEVVIQAERNITKVIPAAFTEENTTVEVVPATKKLVEVPAQYEETEEKVLLQPERTVWKKGTNPAQQLSGATGEIMCLVKLPAKYKTIKKSVLKSPPHTEIEEVPAQTKTIMVRKLASEPKLEHTPVGAQTETIQKFQLVQHARFLWQVSDQAIDQGWEPTGHQVCLIESPAKTVSVIKTVVDVPQKVETITVDANYTAVEVQKLIAESKVEKTPIPAKTHQVKKTKKVDNSHLEWRRILCQTNMTESTLKSIQEALIERGYDPGKPDGKIGNKTKNAIAKFQKDNNLATGGITYETLQALKLSH